MFYIAHVSREGKHLRAEFPDAPGCQTFAGSEEKLREAAQEALEVGWRLICSAVSLRNVREDERCAVVARWPSVFVLASLPQFSFAGHGRTPSSPRSSSRIVPA